MEPIFSGVLFTFACVGVYAFGAQKNGAQAFSTVQKHGDFKLEVDITGRGNWVEQGRGPSKEMKAEGTRIRKREGMSVRITPI